jgi:phosphatidylserine/phosphatidylglycerophosphate/cardiolipin synthase-like enzyme
MAKRSSKATAQSQQKKKYSPQSLIATILGALVVTIAALIGGLGGGLIDVDEPGAPTAIATTPPPVQETPVAWQPGEIQQITLGQGFGAAKDFWQVYFTAPTGSRDPATYHGGVDTVLVQAINEVRGTLDIAAFEWNNPRLTQAVIDAHNRGVQVRMVVDDEHTLEDDRSTINEIIALGVPVVDDSRTGLMHNKFMIMDGTTVWTGSMNYTINGAYRNNNNVLALRSRRAVEAYQRNFNEMFEDRIFGSRTSEDFSTTFNQDGITITVLFSPEGDVVEHLVDHLNRAQRTIHFMTFSFTLDEVGQTLLARSMDGIDVRGIFETRASRTQWSQLPPLFCAGLNILQDGNPFTFHHKVFIVDESVVLTGSFNISNNATNRNDENMVIIEDPDLAAQYIAEFERVSLQSEIPPREAIDCP